MKLNNNLNLIFREIQNEFIPILNFSKINETSKYFYYFVIIESYQGPYWAPKEPNPQSWTEVHGL